MSATPRTWLQTAPAPATVAESDNNEDENSDKTPDEPFVLKRGNCRAHNVDNNRGQETEENGDKQRFTQMDPSFNVVDC